MARISAEWQEGDCYRPSQLKLRMASSHSLGNRHVYVVDLNDHWDHWFSTLNSRQRRIAIKTIEESCTRHFHERRSMAGRRVTDETFLEAIEEYVEDVLYELQTKFEERRERLDIFCRALGIEREVNPGQSFISNKANSAERHIKKLKGYDEVANASLDYLASALPVPSHAQGGKNTLDDRVPVQFLKNTFRKCTQGCLALVQMIETSATKANLAATVTSHIQEFRRNMNQMLDRSQRSLAQTRTMREKKANVKIADFENELAELLSGLFDQLNQLPKQERKQIFSDLPEIFFADDSGEKLKTRYARIAEVIDYMVGKEMSFLPRESFSILQDHSEPEITKALTDSGGAGVPVISFTDPLNSQYGKKFHAYHQNAVTSTLDRQGKYDARGVSRGDIVNGYRISVCDHNTQRCYYSGLRMGAPLPIKVKNSALRQVSSIKTMQEAAKAHLVELLHTMPEEEIREYQEGIGGDNPPKKILLEESFCSLLCPSFLSRFGDNDYKLVPEIRAAMEILDGSDDVLTVYDDRGNPVDIRVHYDFSLFLSPVNRLATVSQVSKMIDNYSQKGMSKQIEGVDKFLKEHRTKVNKSIRQLQDPVLNRQLQEIRALEEECQNSLQGINSRIQKESSDIREKEKVLKDRLHAASQTLIQLSTEYENHQFQLHCLKHLKRQVASGVSFSPIDFSVLQNHGIQGAELGAKQDLFMRHMMEYLLLAQHYKIMGCDSPERLEELLSALNEAIIHRVPLNQIEVFDGRGGRVSLQTTLENLSAQVCRIDVRDKSARSSLVQHLNKEMKDKKKAQSICNQEMQLQQKETVRITEQIHKNYTPLMKLYEERYCLLTGHSQNGSMPFLVSAESARAQPLFQQLKAKRISLLENLKRHNPTSEAYLLFEKEIDVHDLSEQTQHLYFSKDFRDNNQKFDNYNPYAFLTRVATLEYLIGRQPRHFCKSGKDRTGKMHDLLQTMADVRIQLGRYPTFDEERGVAPGSQSIHQLMVALEKSWAISGSSSKIAQINSVAQLGLKVDAHNNAQRLGEQVHRAGTKMEKTNFKYQYRIKRITQKIDKKTKKFLKMDFLKSGSTLSKIVKIGAYLPACCLIFSYFTLRGIGALGVGVANAAMKKKRHKWERLL